ncbi:replication factor C subunit 5 [Echinococcus multilocularis]|uniref:Replication factor C subunit 5 n=1 Tax=Echinococcus multilocularis TaxID=6211 RepID=A0A068Y7N1_ECHMU|nr:replication factor C subunit 5 [Echinococcus multilocularis]
MASDLPWIEKYRPESLDDLIGHELIITTIRRFLNQGKLPHLLFYGPPGTGKTSTILSVAKHLFGPTEFSSMVLELNASDDRGIGVVREQVLTFASTKTLFSGKFKLIILDEADAMTKDAQNALRRIIEKFSENARFCLICNYLSKITQAIQSRCTRFRFPPVQKSYTMARLGEIAKKEGFQLTNDGKVAIHRFSSGDMRVAINLLQSASMSSQVVDEASVYACTGYPTPREMRTLLEWCLNEPLPMAFKKILELKVEKGIALQDIVSELHPLIMQVKMPDSVKVELTTMLSDVEYRMSYSASEKLQLGAVCAAFANARDSLEALEA